MDTKLLTQGTLVKIQTASDLELYLTGLYADIATEAPSDELRLITTDVRYLLTSILGDEYAHARIWNAMLLANSLC